MGSADTKIQTSSMNESMVRAKVLPSPQKYSPPLHRFGDLFRKHNGRNILYTLNVLEPYKEEIKISNEVFLTLQQTIENKTWHLSIETAFDDELILERWLFLATEVGGMKHSLLIRPFEGFDSHTYATILEEIHFANLISKLPTNNLHRIIESYCFPNSNDSNSKSSSQVLVMERVDANLSQIIQFRRNNKLDWSVKEFNKLTSDLVLALGTMHQAGISHNNIRPANVYFSIAKNCFLLGSFDNCSKGNSSIDTKIASAEGQFMAEFNFQSQADCHKNDIYSLGITLLEAFYLTQPLDHQLFIHQNKLLESRYSILKLIGKMVAPIDFRSDIGEIKAQLPQIITDNSETSMIDLINLIRKAKTSDKMAVRWAYQHLGLWSEWKQSYEKDYELAQSSLNKAEANHQLAIIEKCRGDLPSASNYAKKAASIYHEEGDRYLDEKCLEKAEGSYKKAVECAKYYDGQHHADVAPSLQALAQIYFEKNNYKMAKSFGTAALNATAKSESKNSTKWCHMCIRQGKLQTEFGAFKRANKLFDQCLAVSLEKDKLNQQFKEITAEALKYRGYNKMKQASHEQDYVRKSTLVEAQLSLRQALAAYQSMKGDQQSHIVYITKSLGEVEFKKQNYEDSEAYFNKALDLLSHIQNTDKKQSKERADLLCLRGTSQSFEDKQLEAIEDFGQGLKIYRDLYGSDHNRWSALAIGNLARVYANAKQIDKSRQCLKVSMNILSDIAGQDDPDYQHFSRIESHLERFV